ncbi:MAG: hypothetical protein ABFC96_18355 [Thermoguttaceae bacterium]
MAVQVLKGSKQEIVERLAQIPGEVREAIVFVDEPIDSFPEGEDIFAEMEPFTVSVGWADDSREALYTRMEGE